MIPTVSMIGVSMKNADIDMFLEHEPEFFAAVSDLSDHQLTNFSSKCFTSREILSKIVYF